MFLSKRLSGDASPIFLRSTTLLNRRSLVKWFSDAIKNLILYLFIRRYWSGSGAAMQDKFSLFFRVSKLTTWWMEIFSTENNFFPPSTLLQQTLRRYKTHSWETSFILCLFIKKIGVDYQTLFSGLRAQLMFAREAERKYDF